LPIFGLLISSSKTGRLVGGKDVDFSGRRP